MCAEPHVKKRNNANLYMMLATCCGLLAGYANFPFLISMATSISEVFVSLLKLVSLPIIFLSIVSTASGMESIKDFKRLGGKAIKYTLLTTVIAATVALILFVLIDPVRSQIHTIDANAQFNQKSYFSYLLQVVPSNFLAPFVENNVIGVMFLAMLFSLAILTLPSDNRSNLHSFFSSLYAAVMAVTKWVVQLMPIGIWAFITLFVRDLREGLEVTSIALYLSVVVAANLLQGLVVLPSFLKLKGISPVNLFRQMLPALSVAFFTKSSAATLPMAIKCAEENAKIPRKVASFTLPLCTTINMNGCAGFILTTVLFVAMSNGMVITPIQMVLWVFIATIAAVGNAGVPMGCYFLSSALLASMNVPLNILGIILPFYTLIDMIETSINVWSDCCVTAVVDKELKQEHLAAGAVGRRELA